ncbi:MAG: hypothetical protein M1820_008549 [Bogoriella megaspora]|nr:MAG: hypothetical protein M1820_008549 [Bogoriella megaspora]
MGPPGENSINFIHSPDSDSISLTSTRASTEDPDEEFEVQRILYQIHEGGEDRYLVEWAGYPLSRATWAREEDFSSQRSLWDWEDTKTRIENGLEESFDIEVYYDSIERAETEKQTRWERRQKKRAALGFPTKSVRPNPEQEYAVGSISPTVHSGDNETSDHTTLFIKKRQQSSRKVTAKPVRKRRLSRKSSSHSVSSPSVDKVPGNDVDGEPRESPLPLRKRKTILLTDSEPEDDEMPSVDNTSTFNLPEKTKRPALNRSVTVPSLAKISQEPSGQNSSVGKPLKKVVRTNSSPAKSKKHVFDMLKSSTSQAARKSSTSQTTAVKPPANVPGDEPTKSFAKRNVFTNWNMKKTRKPRERVDLEAAKGAQGTQFGTLQERYRFQKFGRHEPAPNPENLTFVDLNPDYANQNLRLREQATTDLGKSPVATDELAQDELEHREPSPTQAELEVSQRGKNDAGSPSRAGRNQQRGGISEGSREMSLETVSNQSTSAAGKGIETNAAAITSVNNSPAESNSGKGLRTIATASASANDTPTKLRHDVVSEERNARDTAVPRGPRGNDGTPWKGKPPITCRRWKLFKDCPYLEKDCRLQHQDSELLEPENGHIPPKYFAKPQMCWFWYTHNSCMRSPQECRFAHWNTGFLSDKYKGAPTRVDSSFNRLEGTASGEPPKEMTWFEGGEPPYIPRIKKTCYYWKCVEDSAPPGLAFNNFQANLNPPVAARDANFTAPPLEDEPLATIEEAPWPTDAAMVFATLNFKSEESEQQPAMTCTVYLHGLEEAVKKELRTQAGESPSFSFSHMCISSDFQSHIAPSAKLYGKGQIKAVSDAQMINRVAEHLRYRSSGVLSFQPNFVLLLYPSDECWGTFADEGASDAKLIFRIYSRNGEPQQASSAVTTLPPLKSESNTGVLFHDILGFSCKSLLTHSDGSLLEPRACLIIPPAYFKEAQLLRRYLHAYKIKVFVSEKWDEFVEFYVSKRSPVTKYNSGVVLIHHTFTSYHLLPSLARLLVYGSINFFQIGPLPPTPSIYTIRPLFPAGGIILLTDALISRSPIKALAMVHLFLAYNKDKPPSKQGWRLVGRPGLVKWVLDLAYQRKDNDLFDLYVLLSDLPFSSDSATKIDMLPPTGPAGGDPHQPPHLIAPEPDTMPGYAELWERDPKAAAEELVQWFAGWCVEQAGVARKFYVVELEGEEEGARWVTEWHHITVWKVDTLIKDMWPGFLLDEEVERRCGVERKKKGRERGRK